MSLIPYGKYKEGVIAGMPEPSQRFDHDQFSIYVEKIKNVIKNREALKGVTDNQLKDHAIAEIRNMTRNDLNQILSNLRKNQQEKNPSHPNNLFAQSLLNSIREELEDEHQLDLSNYELRFYSSVDNIIDYALGVDCWVELVRTKGREEVLATHFIDLTAGVKGSSAQTLADSVLFYEFENVGSIIGKNNVTHDLIMSDSFSDLVESISDNFGPTIKYSK